MNEPPDTPQPDKTIKVDRTAATGRQGNRLGKKAGDSSSHVSKSSLSGTSRLSFLTGILGTRTVNVSEMLNNDTEERDELRVQKRPPSEEDFADFESNFELKEKNRGRRTGTHQQSGGPEALSCRRIEIPA
jgi:hypothetical protein